MDKKVHKRWARSPLVWHRDVKLAGPKSEDEMQHRYIFSVIRIFVDVLLPLQKP